MKALGRGSKLMPRILDRCWVPLAIVLLLAVLLRLATMFAYWPAALQHPSAGDAFSFVESARGGLWDDPTRTVGYPAFLRLAHLFTDALGFTIFVQHALGMVTGCLMYAATRRLGGSRPVALIGAAVMILNGDAVFLEHTLLSDALFITALTTVLYLAARAIDQPTVGWVVGLGLAVGFAVLVRNVALALIPVLLVWLYLVTEGSPRKRFALAGVVLVISLSVLAADAALRAHNTSYEPWSPTSGWTLYARTAQFANCDDFEPPPGTARLCENTSPASRPGPTYYVGVREAPSRRLFGLPPDGNDELGAFARAAIRAQPLDYASTVATDLARYVSPGLERRRFGGLGPEALRIDQTGKTPDFGGYYRDVEQEQRSGAKAIAAYQRIARVHGPLYVLGFALCLVGFMLARGRVRAGIGLLGGGAFMLLLFPSAILTYNPRYGIPPTGPLAAAAALSAAVLYERLRGRPGRTSA